VDKSEKLKICRGNLGKFSSLLKIFFQFPRANGDQMWPGYGQPGPLLCDQKLLGGAPNVGSRKNKNKNGHFGHNSGVAIKT